MRICLGLEWPVSSPHSGTFPSKFESLQCGNFAHQPETRQLSPARTLSDIGSRFRNIIIKYKFVVVGKDTNHAN